MNEHEPELDEKRQEGPRDPFTEGVDAVMDAIGNVVGSVDAALGSFFASGPDEGEQERRRRELSSLVAGQGQEQGRSR